MSGNDTRNVALTTMTHWVAAIADNIRNPVAGTLAALDLVTREFAEFKADGRLDEALVDDSLRRMRERLGRLNEYVSELVDFTRPTSIEQRFLPARDCLEALQRGLGGVMPVTMRLELAVASDLDTVFADPHRLCSALKALVVNGMEAAFGAEEPVVSVRAERHLEHGRAGVAFIVEDNGPGFPDSLHAKVFEPFWSTKEAGTGLGLSIARKYVSAHAGTVTISRSEDLGGARITVFLPDPTPAARSRMQETQP